MRTPPTEPVVPADAQSEPINVEMASPPTEQTAPGPAAEPFASPGPPAVPATVQIQAPVHALVPAAELVPGMVFNARVINLRVYNAGHNVLR